MANTFKYNQKSFSVGDTIQVYARVKEGDKERTQMFEGILIAVKNRGAGQSFTVRKIASGAIGVERIWPLASPQIIDIKKKKSGQVRRAKLYYLRSRTGKQATKIKEADEAKPAPKPKSSPSKSTTRSPKPKSKKK